MGVQKKKKLKTLSIHLVKILTGGSLSSRDVVEFSAWISEVGLTDILKFCLELEQTVPNRLQNDCRRCIWSY